ncbi:hypothetical protein [Sagittula sp. SSi028]|uniref:hypothetical protein n=1 Tax=Sagittula sp. SSi028 TaxID=3400636 RepID=UPI003AF842F1
MRAHSMMIGAFCLSGCMATTPSVQAPRDDGVAQRLALGASRAEADLAFGTEAGFERNPQNYDESCVSNAYGDGAAGPRYVHARFRGDALVARSDGHGAICTYGLLI